MGALIRTLIVFFLGTVFGLYLSTPNAKTQAIQIAQRYIPARIFALNLPGASAILGAKSQTSASSSAEPTIATTSDTELYDVIQVIDGDTIVINTGQKVRYLGIKTPDLATEKTTSQCYSTEARNKNRDLVEGKKIKLIKDVTEADKDGSILRYVYSESKSGEVFVNDALVQEGYAHSADTTPDVKFAAQLKDSEKKAKDSNKGLWSACK